MCVCVGIFNVRFIMAPFSSAAASHHPFRHYTVSEEKREDCCVHSWRVGFSSLEYACVSLYGSVCMSLVRSVLLGIVALGLLKLLQCQRLLLNT